MSACQPADHIRRLDDKARSRIRALVAAAPPFSAAQVARLNAVYLGSLADDAPEQRAA